MNKLNALFATSEAEAVGFLCPMLDLDNKALQGVDDDTFKRACADIGKHTAGNGRLYGRRVLF